MICTVLAPGVSWPYKPKPPKPPKPVIKFEYGPGRRALSEEQVTEVREARAKKVGYALLQIRHRVGRKVLPEAAHGRGAYKWG